MPEDGALLTNPSNEVCPNFAADLFRLLRDDIRQGTEASDDDVIARLVQLWTQDHNERLVQWTAQRAAAAQAADEAEHQRELQEEEAQRLVEQETELERLEAEKKKPKMNDFDESKQIPNVLAP